jgi:hypothetical protein
VAQGDRLADVMHDSFEEPADGRCGIICFVCSDIIPLSGMRDKFTLRKKLSFSGIVGHRIGEIPSQPVKLSQRGLEKGLAIVGDVTAEDGARVRSRPRLTMVRG